MLWEGASSLSVLRAGLGVALLACCWPAAVKEMLEKIGKFRQGPARFAFFRGVGVRITTATAMSSEKLGVRSSRLERNQLFVPWN